MPKHPKFTQATLHELTDYKAIFDIYQPLKRPKQKNDKNNSCHFLCLSGNYNADNT